MFSITMGLIIGYQYKGMKITVKKLDKKKIDEILKGIKYTKVEEEDNVRRYCRNSFVGFLSPNIFIIDDHEIIGPTMWVKKIGKEIA